MIVVVMGVSGVGKTTIGTALAAALGWRFLDADEYHPPGNVAKMEAGIPLEDDDRWPWLDALNEALREADGRGESAVLACSALKERYRRRLTAGLRNFRIAYLYGDFELIERRMRERRHRYMPASLLASQFAALEPPADAIAVEVSGTAAQAVAQIVESLKQNPS
ncbi:MAG TPA: gluconokinase [Burkholderiales bacterium]|nr:gluconokinase [Burkholderiales bacterium]